MEISYDLTVICAKFKVIDCVLYLLLLACSCSPLCFNQEKARYAAITAHLFTQSEIIGRANVFSYLVRST